MVKGKEIVEAAFADVESFFVPSGNFTVNRELNVDDISYASIKGSGVNARIRVSRGICEYEITKIEDYLFVLIILCHELAHYLNFHNEHKDQEELDSVALESRADHFGSQILLVLMTFKTNTSKLIRTIEPKLDQNLAIRSIGKALGDIYQEIYRNCNSELYPQPNLRVGLTVAGCLSFFHRYLGELPKEFTLSFILNVVRAGNLTHILQSMDDSQQEQVVDRLVSTHSRLQQEQPFMNQGFKPHFGLLLTSQFDLSPSQMKMHRESLEAHVQTFMN
ncbi:MULTISPECIES: hypothetical protein [Vibrio]|uniref:hypothetical protein n=1 Tax=Vibrio TaxID=662 RepID=UPI000C85322E|nr:hypothetical protein [Vibrio splendidus]PMO69444.1 hypothetical protein BCT03_24075 [Vibrio splendidus]